MTKPTVLHLIDCLFIGGGEMQMADLLRRIDREKFRPLVGCLRKQGQLVPVLEEAGIVVEEFPVRGKLFYPRSIREIFRLARFMRRERVQIVHTQDLYSHLVGIPAALIARVPVVITNRLDLGHTMKQWHRRALKMLSFAITRVMANSEGVRTMLIDEEKIDPAKIELIYNGVNLDQFQIPSKEKGPVPPVRDFRLEPGDRPIVVVANLWPVKGHEILFEAAVRVTAYYPTAKFVLVGTGAARRAILEARARELAIDKQILFLGPRQDVPQILPQMEISVLPSLAEGFSNAILESMAAGLPMVATDVGGNREAIVEGETGFLVPPRDPETLADRILRLLGDREGGQRMGKAGRERIETTFSLQRMVTETERFYERLLEERGAGARGRGPEGQKIEADLSRVKVSP
ncbi:MAG: glycosyltransferase [Candidatus Manganitrophus sp. SA1]|nr:glycosyltransferase [Candidatus Manganitrophus morganii]